MGTKETITKAIEIIKDPTSGKTLKENKGIKYVALDEDKQVVNLVIGLEKVDKEIKQNVTRELAKILKVELGFTGIKVDFELLKRDDSVLSTKRAVKYIGVASGKGGVGKSTVAANLALALMRLGKKVGLLDADIYGSSIPVLFDMEIKPPKVNEQEKIIPFNVEGIEIISTAFFMHTDQPLMWRGPMLGKMLNHFFYDVAWDESLEWLIIDLPPGTGDVAIDIQKLIPESKMLIVTTPHPSAAHVAIKAGFAAKELEHSLLGVVENMSYYKHNNEKLAIFGKGGGKKVADNLETDLLAQLPFAASDSAHHSLYRMNEPLGVDYLGLANKIVKSY